MGRWIRFPDLFFHQVEKHGERIALRHKEFGIWNEMSWKEYGRRVRLAAAGLIALGLPHDGTVCILSDNRPEWLINHVATMVTGGHTCGIYPTSSSEEIKYIVNHSDCRILFVENEEQLEKILEVIDDFDSIKVIIFEHKGLFGFSRKNFLFYNDFIKLAESYQQENPGAVDNRLEKIKSDDTAIIVYTSGTTGRPKGAMISHGSILFTCQTMVEAMAANENDELLSYLPLAHVYENMLSLFVAVWTGCKVNFVESMETLPHNLVEVSPTIFASVPRIWEKFSSAIEIRIKDSTIVKRCCYRLAMKIGVKWFRSRNEQGSHILINCLYWPVYWMVLWNLKRNIGLERIRYGLCGAAPASAELFAFYNALGIKLREGYGQTESGGVIVMTKPDNPRWGYVGELLPNIDVKIAHDGEILAKSLGVFKGYYKDPELTAETVVDGWLHTGDVGVIEDGFLKILDRKKDIFITAGGKNVTPSFIENKLKFSHYIQDSVVVGDGKKYLTSLILIDEENVTKYATENRIPFTTFADLTQNPEIVKLIDGEVKKVNKGLARVETIKKFRLLPRRFYAEDGDVTPTQKVKRAALIKRYQQFIDEMYRD